MIATNYPVQFLNVPGIWIVVKICKIFDYVGLVHITWLVADLLCRAMKLDDEVSVRLAEYDELLHNSDKTNHSEGTIAMIPNDDDEVLDM